MAKRDEYQPTELSLDDLEAASGGSLLGDFAGGFVAGTSKSSGEHLGYDNTSSAAAWGNSFGWAVAGIATAIPATTIGGLTFAGIKTSFDVAGDVADGRLGAAAIDAGVGIATMGYGGIVAGEAKALGGIIGEGLKSAGIDKVVDDVKSYFSPETHDAPGDHPAGPGSEVAASAAAGGDDRFSPTDQAAGHGSEVSASAATGGDDRFSPTDQAAGHGSEVSASAATGGDDRFSPTDQAAGHGSEVSASAATGGDDRFSPADNSSNNNSGLDSSGSGYSGGGGGYSGGDSGGGGGGGGE
jgi:uncharacterized membrane protein YgcG